MEMMQMDLGDAMGDSDSDTTVDMSSRQPSGMDTPPPREASPSLPQMEGYNPSDSFSDSSSNLLKSGFNSAPDDLSKGNVIDFSSSLENTTSSSSGLLLPETSGGGNSGGSRRTGSVLDSLLDQKLKQLQQKKGDGREHKQGETKPADSQGGKSKKEKSDNSVDDVSDDDVIEQAQVDKEGSECNSEEIMDFGEDEPLMLTSEDEYSATDNTNDNDSNSGNKPKESSQARSDRKNDSAGELSKSSTSSAHSRVKSQEGEDLGRTQTKTHQSDALDSGKTRGKPSKEDCTALTGDTASKSNEGTVDDDLENMSDDLDEGMAALAEDRPPSEYDSSALESEDEELVQANLEAAKSKDEDDDEDDEDDDEDDGDEEDEEEEEYEVYEEEEFDDEDIEPIESLIEGAAAEVEGMEGEPGTSKAADADGGNADTEEEPPTKKRKRVVKKRKKKSDPDNDGTQSDSESGTKKKKVPTATLR